MANAFLFALSISGWFEVERDAQTEMALNTNAEVGIRLRMIVIESGFVA